MKILFFGVSNKFSKHDVSLTSENSFEYPKQMLATYSVTKDYNCGTRQTSREILLHSSDNAPRKNCNNNKFKGGVKETNFYQTKIKLNQQSLAKLK